jgi:hypothetical protein
MFQSMSRIRPTTRFAVLLPIVLFGSACSSSDGDEELDTSAGGDATGNSAPGTGGSAGARSGGNPDGTSNGGSGSGGVAGNPDPPLSGGDAGGAATRVGPAPVPLGTAGEYAVLAESAISNVPTSVITGDLGLSPAAATYITGFAMTRAGMMWTSPEVVGGIFAADNDPTTPVDLTTAVADMHTAYDDAAGRPTPAFLNLGDGAIGGRTLAPGLYKWTSSVTIPSDVTLAGAAADVWIFQIAGDLQLSAAQAMTLTGGAQAKNVVWQVAGFVELGDTSHAEGILLSKTAIHAGTGASVNGRLLAQTAVTLASSTVTAP